MWDYIFYIFKDLIGNSKMCFLIFLFPLIIFNLYANFIWCYQMGYLLTSTNSLCNLTHLNMWLIIKTPVWWFWRMIQARNHEIDTLFITTLHLIYNKMMMKYQDNIVQTSIVYNVVCSYSLFYPFSNI
jgi:hypothetical protein